MTHDLWGKFKTSLLDQRLLHPGVFYSFWIPTHLQNILLPPATILLKSTEKRNNTAINLNCFQPKLHVLLTAE